MISKKEKQRKIIEDNRSKGRAGEKYFEAIHAFSDVKRTGIGHDYRVKTYDPISWKKVTEYHEVKTGKSNFTEEGKEEERQKIQS